MNREKLFKSMERMHRSQAKLPFDQKLRILFALQRMVRGIKGDRQ